MPGGVEDVPQDRRCVLQAASRAFSQGPQVAVVQTFPYFVAAECMGGEPMVRIQFVQLYSYAGVSIPTTGIQIEVAIKAAFIAALFASGGVRKERSAPRGNNEQQFARQLTSVQWAGSRPSSKGERRKKGGGRVRGSAERAVGATTLPPSYLAGQSRRRLRRRRAAEALRQAGSRPRGRGSSQPCASAEPLV